MEETKGRINRLILCICTYNPSSSLALSSTLHFYHRHIDCLTDCKRTDSTSIGPNTSHSPVQKGYCSIRLTHKLINIGQGLDRVCAKDSNTCIFDKSCGFREKIKYTSCSPEKNYCQCTLLRKVP